MSKLIPKVILVRHGQSLSNKMQNQGVPQSVINKIPDSELTELGNTQAKKVATYLNTLIKNKTEVWRSNLLRAKQTSEYINHPNIIPVEELQEHHSPHKAELKHISVDKNWPEFVKRVLYVIDLIRDWCNKNKNTDNLLIIVGHQSFFSCLLTRLCSYETIIPRKTIMFPLNNCSLTTLYNNSKKRWVIERLNYNC